MVTDKVLKRGAKRRAMEFPVLSLPAYSAHPGCGTVDRDPQICRMRRDSTVSKCTIISHEPATKQPFNEQIWTVMDGDLERAKGIEPSS
jgi:hypothetical protein